VGLFVVDPALPKKPTDVFPLPATTKPAPSLVRPRRNDGLNARPGQAVEDQPLRAQFAALA